MPIKGGTNIEGRAAARRVSRSGLKSRARRPATQAEPTDRRPPQHARGHRRVDAILDAASAILVERGAEGLTIEAVAKRSETSKSSMYHFFTDLDSIIKALADRHIAEIVEDQRVREKEKVDWGRLTVEEVVDRYLEPIQSYNAANPDLILVMRMSGSRCDHETHREGLKARELSRAERILAARFPRMKAADRRARAATMLALVVGVMESSTDPSMPERPVMMRELRTAMIAYLRAREKSR